MVSALLLNEAAIPPHPQMYYQWMTEDSFSLGFFTLNC